VPTAISEWVFWRKLVRLSAPVINVKSVSRTKCRRNTKITHPSQEEPNLALRVFFVTLLCAQQW
jgi:hypothetical protein